MQDVNGNYKAGVFVYALVLLTAITFVQQLPVLPELVHLSVLFLCSLSLYWPFYGYLKKKQALVLKRYYTLITICIVLINIGIIYASLYAKETLSHRLDESLTGKNIIITGQVADIPVINGKVQRFDFTVESYPYLAANDNTDAGQSRPKKIRLNWYYGQPVKAGELWQFEVRLKPPHGFMNPGGFDYEAWLFQHGLHATGYVRKSEYNRPVHTLAQAGSVMGLVNRLRQSLSQQIDSIANSQQKTEGTNSHALIKALSIGDKSSISNSQWQVLANTGTSHLMAISGLHIGLASLFAYVFIRRLSPAFVMKRVPAQHIAVTAGMVIALLYALLAGLSIPTQRAIIMLLVLSVMLLIRRNHRPADSLGFALLVVMLIDPLAVLSAGFWFSFSAVAVIFISLSRSGNDKQQVNKSVHLSYWARFVFTVKPVLKQWVRLQLSISLFLLPLSLYMFQQVSLLSPLVNLLLIPYVSFLVVPLVLLAIVSSLFLTKLSVILFNTAAMLLDAVWPVLSYLSEQPYALWIQGDVSISEMLLACMAMLMLFFSKQLSRHFTAAVKLKNDQLTRYLLRLAACVLFVPLFVSKHSLLESEAYQVTVLDVGQGSAAVIRTKNHIAVFDAGAKYSDKLDAGSSVVVPYLRSQGIEFLDRLIISHGDADHIGGAQAILNAYPQATVIGQDIGDLHVENKQECYAGDKWLWDGVEFEFLSPPDSEFALAADGRRNNNSCVLRLRSTAGSVLFTGDIEKKAEIKLLDSYPKGLASDILIAPHHGSNTSSSAAFIAAVNPKIIVFSVGYKNRYKLPSTKVVARYDAPHRKLLQTDKTGAITIKLSSKTDYSIEQYRKTAKRYWHHIMN